MRFVFFSNPRTGSESIREALNPYSDIFSRPADPLWDDHRTPDELAVIFENRGLSLASYFKFCFVRNPWERLVSYYQYFKPDKNFKLIWVTGAWENRLSFTGFVESLLTRSYPFLHQRHFALGKNGVAPMDYVGRYETLEDDWRQICAKLNIEAALPWVNRSRRRFPYQIFYNDRTRKIVAEVFAKDVRLADYRFEPLGRTVVFLKRAQKAWVNLKSRIGIKAAAPA
jgi:hypothetical protein